MDGVFKQLRDNWMIIIFIGSLIVTWTTFNSRLARAEEKITVLEETIDTIQDLRTDIAVIKRDIEYIKVKVQ